MVRNILYKYPASSHTGTYFFFIFIKTIFYVQQLAHIGIIIYYVKLFEGI